MIYKNTTKIPLRSKLIHKEQQNLKINDKGEEHKLFNHNVITRVDNKRRVSYGAILCL